MHSQVRQVVPGLCPICGMALEAVLTVADADSSPELAEMTHRMWLAIAFALPVFLLAMIGHVFPTIRRLVPAIISDWVQFVLTTPIVCWAGAPFFARGWASLKTRHLNMFTLVVDKTGTLTYGKPSVEKIIVAEGFATDEVLRLAAGVERASEHPLARAIVAAAQERRIVIPEVLDFCAQAGSGALGTVADRQVVLGTDKFLHAKGVDAATLAVHAENLRLDGATAIYVAVDGRPAAVISIADQVKVSTRETLETLRKSGIRIVMLTGDNLTTAAAVARKLSIDEVEADLLPGQKAMVIQRLRSEGHIVAMAGDGVNDAPALAAADVGVAMGPGADVAIQSAGITLLKGDLTGIVRARRLSQATMANIRENLIFAFVYNAVGVPIAAGVLYPAFGILLSPIIAAAAMALSSVSVISNALRLYQVKI